MNAATSRIADQTGYFFSLEIHGSKIFPFPYLMIDDEIVFCLQPDAIFLNNIKDYQVIEELQLFPDKEKLETIKLISQFGYQFQGRNQPEWYMTTQKMIWDILGFQSNFYNDRNGQVAFDFSMYIEAINHSIKKMNEKPSFDNQVIQTDDEHIILQDEHYVLSQFTSLDENVSIVDNQLHIYFDNDLQDLELNFIKGTDNIGTSLVYHHPIHQDVGIFKLKEGTESTLRLSRIPKGQISVLKLDDDYHFPLADVTFDIFDMNHLLIETISTDAWGVAKSKLIPFGEYYIKETSTNHGYLLNEEIYIIQLNESLIEKEVFNKKTTYKIRLEKHDTFSSKILYGAQFKLYQSGHFFKDIDLVNGAYEIMLETGQYELIEVKAPINYRMNDIPTIIYVFKDETIKIYNEPLSLPKTGTFSIMPVIFLTIGIIFLLNKKT